MPRAITRAIRILESLGPSEEGLTHTQIAQTLNIPKSSVTAILSDLVAGNCIYFDPLTKKYRLGPKIISLAQSYLEDQDIVKIGGPIAEDLTKETGESVAIYIQSGTEAQLVCKQNSPQPVSRFLSVGARAPMYAIAAGKVLLAYLSKEELDNYLSSVRLEPITPYTITKAEQLILELEQVRVRALAYNQEEFDESVIGIAAPVHDRLGQVIAALCVVAPSFRMNPKRRQSIEKALKTKAEVFSNMMGFVKKPKRAIS